VDDRDGWLVRYDLQFPRARQNGWNFTAESVAFVVVDRGNGRPPGLFFVSMPNSHKTPGDLYLLLNSLRPL
jgi:hypothetical protein